MYEQDAAVQMYYVILFMLYYIAMIGIVIYLCYDMHMSVNVITTIVRTRRNVVCPHFSIGSKSADRQVFCLSAKMMGLGAGWATSAIGYCTRVACSQIVL